MTHSIKNIEVLHVSDELFGANQNLYEDKWKKQSGCGPCAATNLIFYHMTKHENTPNLLDLMNIMWEYVTPTLLGVNKISIFIDGLAKYNNKLQIKSLHIPNICMRKCISHDDFIKFIIDSIDDDNPVAFLNLSNGRLNNLGRWHWVTIFAISLKDGDYHCIISDEGQKKEINISLWFRTSSLGGGLVSICDNKEGQNVRL